jgi:gliding-associated putative ABC transporter substrate-binding component GldG
MKPTLISTIALVIGILIVINLLGNEFHVRFDLTEDRQYTLSDATRDILDDLEEPVTVKAYFSKNVPPEFAKARQDFQDLLIEYANRSDNQVVYEFINPNEKESLEQEAVSGGIRPVLINVREKDQVKQQKAYLGATVQLGEKKEVIPFLQPGAAMEYALSTAIKKIAIDNKPVVGFLTGHGEPPLSEMQQANQQLSVLYQTKEIKLTDSTVIADDIKTLALIRPTDSIPSKQLDILDGFLKRGGRMLVAVNHVQADFRSLYGTVAGSSIKKWLEPKGVEIMDNFVVDAHCGAVKVPQQLGIFTVEANVSFPYVPVISTFSDHPITTGLEQVMFEFASELTFRGDSTETFYPLAFSSEQSNTLPAPQFFDINKEWTENDFPRNKITVAAAIERNPMKMVVISDGDFPVNGPPDQARNLQPDQISLLSNAVDWLSDDTGLIELRTKGVVSRPIRQLEESTKTLLKYGNFLLPILLVIGYGILRTQQNRIRRFRRMSENYESY